MQTKSFIIKRLPELKNKDKNKFMFIASDETPDRYGDIVSVNGWELDNYKKNSVILFNHNSMSLPIAKATDMDVIDNQLVIDVEFDMKDELIRQTIMNTREDVIEIKEDIKMIKKKLYE